MSIMRKLSVLTFAMAIAILVGCSTPTTHNQNKKIEAEVLSSLEGFQKSYGSMEVESVSTHFNNPTTLIGPGGVSISVAKEDFNSIFTPVIVHLEDNEYARSEWRNIDVKVLDKDLAIASADIAQYDINGETVEDFGVTFSMGKNGTGWKITTVSTHPSSDAGQK